MKVGILRTLIGIFACLGCLILILFIVDYTTRNVPYFERVRLRYENKINVDWLYGIPGSFDVILTSVPGRKYTDEEVEVVAREFKSKFGGNITFINKWGPNFGIENISEDSAYTIASDARVQAVLSRYSASARPRYH